MDLNLLLHVIHCALGLFVVVVAFNLASVLRSSPNFLKLSYVSIGAGSFLVMVHAATLFIEPIPLWVTFLTEALELTLFSVLGISLFILRGALVKRIQESLHHRDLRL